MAYVLTRPEAITEELQRILSETCSAAHEALRAGPEGISHGIHECRKHVKKACACLRLARYVLPRGTVGKACQSIKAPARLIADMREHQAHLECLDWLLGQETSGEQRVMLVQLRHHFSQAPSSVGQEEMAEQSSGAARVQLTACATQLKHLDWRNVDIKHLARGLETTYHRGKVALRRAQASPDAALLHAWRKRAKDLRYQIELLMCIWPGLMAPLASELHALTDCLGRNHDLHLLAQTVEREAGAFFSDVQMHELGEMLMQWARHEEHAAFRQGQRLYAESSRSFMLRFRKYLKIWKNNKDLGSMPANVK